MRRFRLIFIFISIVLIIVILAFTEYDELISKSNLGAFPGIVSVLFTIFAMVLSNMRENRNKNPGKNQ